MNPADEVEALQQRLAQLEQGPAVIGDWHRLVARAARLMVCGQTQLARLQCEMIELVRTPPPDPKWFGLLSQVHTLRDSMEDVRLVRLCAESRAFELEAEAIQRDVSNGRATGRA